MDKWPVRSEYPGETSQASVDEGLKLLSNSGVTFDVKVVWSYRNTYLGKYAKLFVALNEGL